MCLAVSNPLEDLTRIFQAVIVDGQPLLAHMHSSVPSSSSAGRVRSFQPPPDWDYKRHIPLCRVAHASIFATFLPRTSFLHWMHLFDAQQQQLHDQEPVFRPKMSCTLKSYSIPADTCRIRNSRRPDGSLPTRVCRSERGPIRPRPTRIWSIRLHRLDPSPVPCRHRECQPPPC